MTAFALFTRYYVVRRSLEINAEYAELIQSARTAATAQLEAGRSSLQDVLQAEVELAQVECAALELTAERDVVVAQMNELLQRDPDAPLPPASIAFAREASLLSARLQLTKSPQRVRTRAGTHVDCG